MNVAVPVIIDDLGLTVTDVEWVDSLYLLVFAALIIPLGRIGDQRGRSRLFAIGIMVFLLASLLAAVAGSGPLLIGARGLQGVGAAMAMPMTLAIINSTYSGRQRIVGFAIWGSIVGGMAAVGPLIGGWLVTDYGWRAAFWINLPIGALVLLGALRIPSTRSDNNTGHDPLGIVLVRARHVLRRLRLIEESERYRRGLVPLRRPPNLRPAVEEVFPDPLHVRPRCPGPDRLRAPWQERARPSLHADQPDPVRITATVMAPITG